MIAESEAGLNAIASWFKAAATTNAGITTSAIGVEVGGMTGFATTELLPGSSR